MAPNFEPGGSVHTETSFRFPLFPLTRLPVASATLLAVASATRLAVALATLLLVAPVTAEEAGDSESVRRGALTYRTYCQSCHGPEGRGDGSLAAELKHPPADLSSLARRAGGRFPTLEVRRKIDGRDPAPSHGPSEMPVWGPTFELRGEDSPEVERRIDDLVALLRTLQSNPAPED